ncbi:OLC1v1023524C1 [Oldenlandia corymbosa var. corymbosa]|uniref:OLC1v1023524C1 n=1 Tax=Oldenlandia corymbosa var. corymbosa TaxID=529605 RepID=A0AAV1C066_OLDCO|nr:OLC1v1023524C1 [Oldenlandia corymbosa var. corymbosa]
MDEPLLSKEQPQERKLSFQDPENSPLQSQSSHHHFDNNTEPLLPSTSNSSLANHLVNCNKKRNLIRRSNSAPSILSDVKVGLRDSLDSIASIKSVPLTVKQALAGVAVYKMIGVLIYLLKWRSFRGIKSWKLVDALYFNVVTLCTIGYGDIVPDTTFTKMYTCGLILIGFGSIDILLNGLVSYVLDRQEAVLLSMVDQDGLTTVVRTYMIDTAKGRMRIRIKVGLALVVVVGCIALGTVMVHILEELSWVDSFYLSVSSVTTVGYGDYAFSTLRGRCFAIIWLLVSTLAVARAFLYLTELRIDRRNRKMAKWVLERKITPEDLVAADLDHNGSIRYTTKFP